MKRLVAILVAVILILGFSAYTPSMPRSEDGPQERHSGEPVSLMRDEPQAAKPEVVPASEIVVVSVSETKEEQVVPPDDEPAITDTSEETKDNSPEVLEQTEESDKNTAAEDIQEAVSVEIVSQEETVVGEVQKEPETQEQTPEPSDAAVPDPVEEPVTVMEDDPPAQEGFAEEIAQSDEPAEIPTSDITEEQDAQALPTPHEHSFVLSAKTEPGCTDTGKEIYTCLCGESYEESIDALGHDWVLASEYEVVDQESYCRFRYAVIWCTSPYCFEDHDQNGRMLTSFSAADYDYSYEKLMAAYSTHDSEHLLNGQQASFTAKKADGTASAELYDYLFAEQCRTPRAVTSLELVPAVTHTEQVFRCSRCSAEK